MGSKPYCTGGEYDRQPSPWPCEEGQAIAAWLLPNGSYRYGEPQAPDEMDVYRDGHYARPIGYPDLIWHTVTRTPIVDPVAGLEARIKALEAKLQLFSESVR